MPSGYRPQRVDACHAQLVAKGVTILRGPIDLPEWRHRTLFFRDPEDNVIEIYAEYGRQIAGVTALPLPAPYAAG